ncbi:hypothetical protein BUALT_Bualt04G0092800 [Buddleja alternifolia]|uniref:BHLH domain-containing protein n=1 Tax=Buddleja alternifolia TaxID=168488 RepID=A0AAV6XYR6_9LAMI|nr:hypothetical protein BUALT_Bualt04G0092800 [Buddleja alternifolia]
MAPMIETHFPNEFFPNTWTLSTPNFDNQTPDLHFPTSTNTTTSLLELISPAEFNSHHQCPFGEFQPFLDALTSPEFGSFYDSPVQEEYAPNVGSMGFLDINGFEDVMSSYKVEIEENNILPNLDTISLNNNNNNNNNNNVDLYGEKKSKSKKPNGQPSKNLMAERRRRKRLNDRLSMLRSIVPKISKMDRTSILGDTIDYMRELLDKIQKLREEGMDESVNLVGNYLKELKPNEMLVRNPSKVYISFNYLISNHTKFDVERRKQDTRVDVCCSAKPGLLLSTLSTLDVLGLDIQQCVISCFNDFSLQASCYEVAEHRSLVTSEDVKQALFRNAGYGGRCL